MLELTIHGEEHFDEEKEIFFTVGDVKVELEHSLASISKWESVWEKPYLGPTEKTYEETLSYVKMMAVSNNVDDTLLAAFTSEHYEAINTYINAKMTATWFNDKNQKPSREVITAEIIYYWMVSLQIPFECQHWHLSKLLALIKVCSQKNAPAKKMGKSDLAAQNRALNEQRKRDMRTRG